MHIMIDLKPEVLDKLAYLLFRDYCRNEGQENHWCAL